VDQAAQLRKMKVKAEMTGVAPSEYKAVEKQRNSGIRVLAVTSGKGGVGKTHVSANLAYSLARLGKRVLVFDADMGLANIDIILGLTPRYNLHHVLQGKKTLQEVLITGPGDIGILPAASGIKELADLTRGQKMTLIEELDNLDERYDYMIIDTAAGITGNVLYFNMAAKEIVVVVSPEPTSITDAYALIKILYQSHAEKRIMLLVNMARSYQEARDVYRRVGSATEHFLDLTIEYLGYVMYDEKVADAARLQKALVEAYPGARASQCLMGIARKLSREPAGRYNIGSMKFFSNAIIGRDCE